MKKNPTGLDDFEKIIANDYFYLDKTKFIEDIINDGAEIKLFTRPRRFGTTLNISLLKCFSDIKNAYKIKKLFDNLYISTSPAYCEQGRYPLF